MSRSNHSPPALAAIAPGRVLGFGGLALLVGVGVALGLEHRRTPELAATLHAETTAVTISRPATVAEVFVKPGMQVTPGTPLARLSDERLEAKLTAKRREIAMREAELQKAQAQADVDLEWRLRDVQQDSFETQLKVVAFVQERISRQVEQIAWRDRLAASDDWLATAGLPEPVAPIVLTSSPASPARLQALLREDAATSTVETLDAQIKLCETRLVDLQRIRRDLEEKVRISAGVPVAETLLEQARQEAAALETQISALTITSPGYGTVGTSTRYPGDVLASGDVLLELLDHQQRSLIVGVASEVVGHFAVGQKLALVFPGQVRRQGTVAELPPQTARKTNDSGDAIVAVKVLPAGRMWPQVPIGSRVLVERPR